MRMGKMRDVMAILEIRSVSIIVKKEVTLSNNFFLPPAEANAKNKDCKAKLGGYTLSLFCKLASGAKAKEGKADRNPGRHCG